MSGFSQNNASQGEVIRRVIGEIGSRVLITPWRDGDTSVAIQPFSTSEQVSLETVLEALDLARDFGFSNAFSSAILPTQAQAFYEANFVEHERLALLTREISAFDLASPSERLRNMRNIRRFNSSNMQEWEHIIDLDNRAFGDPLWRFDRVAFDDAIRATPEARFAVTRTSPVVGYHIVGRSGIEGYLQRVAVAPEAARQGWGKTLVQDALCWLARNGATRASVNTQLNNQPALRLYESCGFKRAESDLLVLKLDL